MTMLGRRADKPFIVRDPIHGYIGIAAHERDIVDHAIAQRLRRVCQTGLADNVFPEARTSRFAHSLGAMHLASRMFASAIQNAEHATVKQFVEDLSDVVKLPTTVGEKALAAVLNVAPGVLLLPSATLPAPGPDDTHHTRISRLERIILTIGEAALRLAALFHDLGHLPFSHDFEQALRFYCEGGGSAVPELLAGLAHERAPHEQLGHNLALLVFRSAPSDDLWLVTVRDLAYRILNEPPLPGSLDALGWLHSLIDGELDVDRADYLLRDGRALALDFATYDLDRLLYNIILRQAADDTAGRTYYTVVREQGLSPLESFFLARSRSHQAFVRHHKVVGCATALVRASEHCLSVDETRSFRDDLVRLTEPKSLSDDDADAVLGRFEGYDDGWWFQILREQEELVASNDLLLQACFAQVLRRNRTLRSAWKRRSELSAADAEAVNAALAPEALSSIRQRLRAEGLLLATFSFKSYEVDPLSKDGRSALRVLNKEDVERPASELSPIFHAIQEIWNRDVHAFVYGPEGKATPQNAIRLITNR